MDVGLLVIDPLVRIGQGFNENDNVDQDLLFQRVQWLVAEQDCGVLIDDHFAKAGGSDDQNAVRGASAKVNAARCAVTLTQMKVEDHKRLRPPKPRRNYVLFSMPKTNYSGRPEGDRWLEMTEFEVGNGETRPALIWRDLVAAQEFFDAYAWEHKDRFLDMVAAGRNGEPWIASTHGAKETRLDCAMVAAGLASSGKEAVDIIAHFAEEAMIEKTERASRHRNVATIWTCTGRRERP
jgi:hypothetical protein